MTSTSPVTTETVTFVRPAQPDHHGDSGDRDIGDHFSGTSPRERNQEFLNEIVVSTKTAKPEKLVVVSRASPASVTPVLVRPVTSEETETFRIRDRPLPVQHVTPTNRAIGDSSTCDLIASRYRPPAEEVLLEQVSTVSVPRAPSEEEFLRTRTDTALVHQVGYSDRELGDVAPGRPVLITSVSETDLAPKRRISAANFRAETVESGEKCCQMDEFCLNKRKKIIINFFSIFFNFFFDLKLFFLETFSGFFFKIRIFF